MEFSCPFTIETSHRIEEIESKGDKAIELGLPISLSSQKIFGKNISSLDIEKKDTNSYEITVQSDEMESNHEIIKFLNEFGIILGFLISEKETNPLYGTHYINFHFFKISKSKKNNASLEISDKVEIKLTRPLKVNPDDFSSLNTNDLLTFFIDGLKAESEKSKYFFWFLILEYLENQDDFRSRFSGSRLFSEDEIEKVTSLADGFGDPRKKDALLGIKNRTQKTRTEKLTDYLISKGIHKYKSGSEELEVTTDVMQKIIKARNALFHSGNTSISKLLYFELFPIVQKILNLEMRKTI